MSLQPAAWGALGSAPFEGQGPGREGAIDDDRWVRPAVTLLLLIMENPPAVPATITVAKFAPPLPPALFLRPASRGAPLALCHHKPHAAPAMPAVLCVCRLVTSGSVEEDTLK